MSQTGTETETGQSQPEVFKIGRDRVTIENHRVVVDAAAEMADWQVRAYSRIPIWFRERKYFLRHKAPGAKPYAVQYTLELWPSDLHETPTRALSYDAETVAERDAAIRTGKLEELGYASLVIFYPFLGLLWSGTKVKLARFGFAPRSITGISVFTSFGLTMLQMAYAQFLLFTSLRSGHVMVGGLLRAWTGVDALVLGPIRIGMVWLDVLLFLLLLSDTVLRYTQHLKDVDMPWGFCEWLFRGFRKAESLTADSTGVAPEPTPAAPAEKTSDPMSNAA